MGDSDLVPYSRAPRGRYKLDFGNGEIEIELGTDGISVVPGKGSSLTATDVFSAAAYIISVMNRFNPDKYRELVTGINSVINRLKSENVSELNPLELVLAHRRGPVGEADILDIGSLSSEALTAELRALFKSVTGTSYFQLPLPLKFE